MATGKVRSSDLEAIKMRVLKIKQWVDLVLEEIEKLEKK